MESQDSLPYQAQESQGVRVVFRLFDREQRKRGSSAFFLDVSDFFLEKNNRLSPSVSCPRVAEMQLENPQLLRILGYRLMQIGRRSSPWQFFRKS